MLTFFRFNTLFHIISLLIVILLIKFPFFNDKLPILLTELEWMLIGQKIHDGEALYKEIWTNVGPLSAGTYWLIDTFFGRSQLAYEFVAILIIYFQSLFFAFICNQRQTFLEKNYAPAIIYTLLMCISFDIGKLSPALLSTTFLLFALNKVIKLMERREGVSDEVFEIGLYIGIAGLFHQPSMVFILWSIASLVFFTNANIRQHFLSLLGFSIPLFACYLYFYFFDSLDEFKFNWFNGIFRIKQYTVEDFKSAFISVTLPIIISVLGFLRLSTASRYNSFQQRTQQIVLLWGVSAILALFLSPNVAPMQFILIIPCFAYFITGFFIHLRGAVIPEIAFTIMVAVILLIHYQGVRPFFGKGFEQLSDMRVKPMELPQLMHGQKMLVIGERIDEYKYGYATTCYLNWDLSKIDLQNPDNYESIINIFDNFKKSQPSVIIDKENVIPKIFQRIPELAKDYKTTSMKGVYMIR